MNLLLKRPSTLNITFAEITQYSNDLQRFTLLRDKATDRAERESYDHIINIMQQVAEFLNETLQKQLSEKANRR